MTISTSDALKAQQACYAKAKELGIEGVICIMDDSARLVSKLRMDGATLSCLEIAERKAYTSVMNRKPSDFFASFVQPNGLLVGLPALGGGRYTVIAGGLPVFRDGVFIGAIGFSGGPPAKDVEIASAGVAVLEKG